MFSVASLVIDEVMISRKLILISTNVYSIPKSKIIKHLICNLYELLNNISSKTKIQDAIRSIFQVKHTKDGMFIEDFSRKVHFNVSYIYYT